jgi:hypothetical protein
MALVSLGFQGDVEGRVLNPQVWCHATRVECRLWIARGMPPSTACTKTVAPLSNAYPSTTRFTPNRGTRLSGIGPAPMPCRLGRTSIRHEGGWEREDGSMLRCFLHALSHTAGAMQTLLVTLYRWRTS